MGRDEVDPIRRPTVRTLTLGLVAFTLIVLSAEIYFLSWFAAPWIDQQVGRTALVIIGLVGAQLSFWALRRVWVRALRHYKHEAQALRLANGKESRNDGDAD
ncbi:hypothetical protein [Cypionkella sp.]|uniref:hypothetical protein n=1 Tax=Cypionkella sp. TaxID=2811411 RepID=UPI002ABCA0DF|nr:hypothetical protein [Cypionkella sp.]MDZ4391366.1 hypothetical protein [Cypionkella sp.]